MSHRRVRFSEPLHQVEYLDLDIDVETVTNEARVGTVWTQAAADRRRFGDRIEKISGCISRVLAPEFRQRIYRERFVHFNSLGPTEQPKQTLLSQNTKQKLSTQTSSPPSSSGKQNILELKHSSPQKQQPHNREGSEKHLQQNSKQRCTNRKPKRRKSKKRR